MEQGRRILDRLTPGAARTGIVFCSVSAAAAAHGWMGIHEGSARRTVAVALLVVAALLGRFRLRSRWTVLALASLLLFHFFPRAGSAWLALSLAALSFTSPHRLLFLRLALAALVFEGFHLVRHAGWTAADFWAEWSAALSGGKQVLGPTPLAAPVWILGVILGLVTLCTGGSRRRPVVIAALALGLCGLMVIQVHVRNPWFLSGGIALLGSLLREPEQEPPHRRAPAVAGAVAAVAGALWLAFPWSPDARPGKVFLHQPGLFSLDRPVDGVYGPRLTEGPYLSLMADFLRASGREFETGDARLSDELLQSCRILMLVNPLRPFEESEISAFERFVRRGGSVLVLGEHTNVDGVRTHLNALLRNTGIRLNDDTAVPADRAMVWGYDVEAFDHPAVWHARGEDDFQLGMGCSLSLDRPARPLLVGRSGFSDAADPAAADRAYLGNLEHEPGERLGDIVLAAESRLGRGRIIAFGDSLTFQNSMLARTWPFVHRLFEYLEAGPPDRPLWPGLVLLGIGFAMLVRAAWPGAVAAAAFGLAASLGAVEAARLSIARASIGNLSLRADVAWIEWAARPLVYRFGGDHPDSIDGLILNLARRGYLPLCRLEGVPLGTAHLLIVPASAKRIEGLGSFMRGGGVVLATVGRPDRGCIEPLLESTGLGFGEQPLGPGGEIRTTEEGLEVKFYSAWPIVDRGNDLLPVALAWNFPVVGIKPVGRGGFCLIADSHFFTNKNLEGYETVSEKNVAFTRALLELLRDLR